MRSNQTIYSLRKWISRKTSRSTVGQGQTVIEAVAAIAVVIIVVTALVSLGVRAVRSATIARNRAQAAAYAQEAIEALRSIRDRGYTELPSIDGSYQLSWSGTQWGYTSGEEVIGIFTRTFGVTSTSFGKHVTARVKWQDVAGDHEVTLDTYLTDWR